MNIKSFIQYTCIFIKIIKTLLINKNKIKKNCYISLRSSFGHACIEIDWAKKIYKNDLTFIFINHINKNLFFCYEDLNYFSFETQNEINTSIKHQNKILYFFIKILLKLFNKKIIHRFKLQSYSNNPNYNSKILINNNYVSRFNHTGYYNLLKKDTSIQPRLIDKKINILKSQNIIFHNLLKQPIICVCLRNKKGDYSFNLSRNSGDNKNYVSLINLFASNGYNVVGIGETNHNAFCGIENYFPSSSFKEKELFEIFVLTYCNFYIGQASGPATIPISRNIPVLLTDVGYYFGTLSNELTLILCKKIFNKTTKTIENPINFLRDNSKIIYEDLFYSKNYDLLDNSSDDLIKAGNIMFEYLSGNSLKLLKSKKYTDDLKINISNDLDLKFIPGSYPYFYFE
tara:strand:- start:7832 stop:9031 length:1200 start_codon:yes stop_codon:yes gene_type:complete